MFDWLMVMYACMNCWQELTGLAKMRREADAVEMLWLDDDASLEEEGEGEEREEQLPELDLRLDEQGTRAGPAPVPVGGSKAGEGSSGRNGHGSRKGKEAGEEEVVEVM